MEPSKMRSVIITNLIPQCFGVSDRKFAMHPIETKHAQQLLMTAIEKQMSWSALHKEIKKWLVSQKCTPEHIKEQMERIENISSWF